jgi:hypothetical protein
VQSVGGLNPPDDFAHPHGHGAWPVNPTPAPNGVGCSALISVWLGQISSLDFPALSSLTGFEKQLGLFWNFTRTFFALFGDK